MRKGTNAEDTGLIKMGTPHKICSICHADKPLDDFYVDRDASDGHMNLCKVCSKARSIKWAKNNPKRVAKIAARWERNNPDKRRVQTQKWTKENPDRRKEITAKWQDNNPEAHQASLKKGRAKWDAANPAKVTAKTVRHRAKKFHATPEWVNEFFIEEAYALAKLRTKVTGIKWEVDHIIPLNSKTVCGLHVEDNLQVIPKRQNRVKHNKYNPDNPHIKQSPWPQCFQQENSGQNE